MTLRSKILLGFAGGLVLGFGLFAFWVRDRLRDSYGQSVEELMIDGAQLLAALVENEARAAGSLSTGSIARLFTNYKAHRFGAKIFDLPKDDPSLDVYVTDAKGIVVYSSEGPQDAGRDFSRWRDVRLTLDGKYGSRSTRLDPNDKRTSVFYVAAPVHDAGGAVIGSVSLIKHRASVAGIVEGALRKMLWLGFLVLALTLGLGGLLFRWITLPLERLRHYARAVTDGQKVALPRLSGGELRDLGHAFEEMRVALEGKKSVERLAQALSHEIKSPLSAIQGAAELLQEPAMEPARKARFLANIIDESKRARSILEQLLEVAALEAKRTLDRVEAVPLVRAIDAAREGLLGLYSQRQVEVRLLTDATGGTDVHGDPFLIQHSIRNLLQNAVEFSPPGREVRAWIERVGGELRIAVEDEGPGVPEFAQDRLFEKFFSMERPDTGRKGSGLGLSFVREAMELHGGRVWLESPASHTGGTRAWLAFPAPK